MNDYNKFKNFKFILILLQWNLVSLGSMMISKVSILNLLGMMTT